MIHSGTGTNMQISWLAVRSSVSRTSLLKCVILSWQQQWPSPQTGSIQKIKSPSLPSMNSAWASSAFPSTECLVSTSNAFLGETQRRVGKTLWCFCTKNLDQKLPFLDPLSCICWYGKGKPNVLQVKLLVQNVFCCFTDYKYLRQKTFQVMLEVSRRNERRSKGFYRITEL